MTGDIFQRGRTQITGRLHDKKSNDQVLYDKVARDASGVSENLANDGVDRG